MQLNIYIYIYIYRYIYNEPLIDDDSDNRLSLVAFV